jgi:transposase InsO family protein
LADITYIPTSEGWLYLAVILDLFTRKVVGWAMRDHMRAELTIAALTMAIQRQRPGAGLIHHSDRGKQGGINWSSQHNREECCDGRETAVGSSVTGQVEVARAAGDGAT